jgi:curved DNA-binding protein CbpA
MPPDQNHYRVLGVSRRANFEQIRAAYVAQLKRYHPDSGDDEAEHQNGAHVHRIVAAYNTLKDPKRRAAYDAELRQFAERQASVRQPAPRPRPATVPYVTPVPRRRRRKFKVDLNTLVYLSAAIAAAVGIQLLVWGYAKYQKSQVIEVHPASLVRKLDDLPTQERLEPVAKLAGMLSGPDATSYSSQCFAKAARNSNPTAADVCIAFDTAFVYWRETAGGAFIADPYFQNEAMKARFVNAFSKLDPDAAMVRTASIRAATFQTLLRLSKDQPAFGRADPGREATNPEPDAAQNP